MSGLQHKLKRCRLIFSLIQKIPSEIDIIVCPSFVNLDIAVQETQGSRIHIGAQTLSEKKEGAFTGEVSGSMLRSIGCQYVIIGHSERRAYYHETPAQLGQKILAAWDSGLTPIFCIGESLEEIISPRRPFSIRADVPIKDKPSNDLIKFYSYPKNGYIKKDEILKKYVLKYLLEIKNLINT